MNRPLSTSRRGGLSQYADATRRIGDTVLDSLRRPFDRQLVRDLSIVLGLVALAVYSLFRGFDLSLFVTGDALYPVHVQYFPWLEFRAPPASGYFPDVFVHLALAPFVADPLWQKMIAGWLIFAGSVLAIGMWKGPLAAVLVTGALFLSGFGFLDTTSHYSLPLMLLIYQLAKPRWLQGLMLFLVVSSDMLILLPLTVLLFAKGEEKFLLERAVIIGLALVWEIIYSEGNHTHLQLAIVLVPFALAALTARVYDLTRLYLFLGAGALIVIPAVGAQVGYAPDRYTVPVAACFMLMLFDTRRPQFDWRFLAMPAAALAIFVGTVNGAHLTLLNSQYDCLLKLLDERGIHTIAADHWTAKPLFFAAREQNYPLVITQTDFVKNTNDNYMAPYANLGEPTRYSFRSNTVCADIWNEVSFPQQNCSQDTIADIESREQVCNGLELFVYKTEIPKYFTPPSSSKFAAVWGNLEDYLNKSF